VPVEALWDRETGLRVTFRNLLQRQGYASLDEVRAEGEAQGRAEGEALGLRRAITTLLLGRGLAVDDDLRLALAGCGDLAVLEAALLQATSASVADLLATLRS
jgi:hypothetical protein